MNDWISKKFLLIIMYVMQLSFGKNYFPLFIVCGNRFYFGHVFIKQLMHFPSGILLYKNLSIYSMVNQISFCFRNSIFFFIFLSGKFKKFPLLIVCRIRFYFGYVFIRQLMHFPSGILLYKDLPIYSMVNRISFWSRNFMFFFYVPVWQVWKVSLTYNSM